jgi:hypothetical protein
MDSPGCGGQVTSSASERATSSGGMTTSMLYDQEQRSFLPPGRIRFSKIMDGTEGLAVPIRFFPRHTFFCLDIHNFLLKNSRPSRHTRTTMTDLSHFIIIRLRLARGIERDPTA